MNFVYHQNAGQEILTIEGQSYTHIYQARRAKFEKNLFVRNLRDEKLYIYVHSQISRNKSELRLYKVENKPVLPYRNIHLIWAIVDVKIIEKTLAYLNQIGVGKISFFYANRSQKNEKISMERLSKILIASCEQCGRSSLVEIEILSDMQEVLKSYPKACLFDFGGKSIYLHTPKLADGIIIGPEGGFDEREKMMFQERDIYSTPSNITLKSECAAILLASLAAG